MTKLLVTYGYYADMYDVEIFNLDPTQPDLICDNLPDLPCNKQGATGKTSRMRKTSKMSKTSKMNKTSKMSKTSKMNKTSKMSKQER
jgi:hypothetical protein